MDNFVLKRCNILQSKHICEQYCPGVQPETTFAFCTVIQKCRGPPKPKPCEAVPQEFGFSARRNHESQGCSQIPGMRAQ